MGKTKKAKPEDGWHRSLENGERALHVYISGDLFERFRQTAFRLGIPQKAIIIEFLKEWLSANENKEGRSGRSGQGHS